MDGKAKTAVTAVILIVLAIIGLGLRGCVVAMTPEQTVAAGTPDDQQIVLIGQRTMFLEPGSVGSRIAQWLNAGSSGTRAFGVGERSFQPGSDELNADGAARLERFVQMMQADRQLNARLLVSASDEPGAAQNQQLAEKRARRLRSEIVARGVPASRITAAAEPMTVASADPKWKQPPIVVVLSK
jgi:hypothetical protein